MKPNDLQLAAMVDQLADVNAKIAELQNLASEIKNALIDSNQASISGAAYKAAIKFNEPKPSVDYKKVVEFIGVDAKILKKFQKVRAPFYSVSLFDL